MVINSHSKNGKMRPNRLIHIQTDDPELQLMGYCLLITFLHHKMCLRCSVHRSGLYIHKEAGLTGPDSFFVVMIVSRRLCNQ